MNPNAHTIRDTLQRAAVPSPAGFLPSSPSETHFDALSYLLTRKGQIVTITARRSMKTLKSTQAMIEKLSVFQARAGINYDNVKAVKEKRESGELPAENAGLPWGEWHQFPYVIRHKGKFYFRLYTVANNFTPKTVYFVNGVESDRATVEPLCLASEFYDKITDCFTYPLEGILSVS